MNKIKTNDDASFFDSVMKTAESRMVSDGWEMTSPETNANRDPRANDTGVFRIESSFYEASQIIYTLLSNGYSVTVKKLNKETDHDLTNNWFLITYYF